VCRADGGGATLELLGAGLATYGSGQRAKSQMRDGLFAIETVAVLSGLKALKRNPQIRDGGRLHLEHGERDVTAGVVVRDLCAIPPRRIPVVPAVTQPRSEFGLQLLLTFREQLPKRGHVLRQLGTLITHDGVPSLRRTR